MCWYGDLHITILELRQSKILVSKGWLLDINLYESEDSWRRIPNRTEESADEIEDVTEPLNEVVDQETD